MNKFNPYIDPFVNIVCDVEGKKGGIGQILRGTSFGYPRLDVGRLEVEHHHHCGGGSGAVSLSCPAAAASQTGNTEVLLHHLE